MAKEHEFRFVCNPPPNIANTPGTKILQGYIHVDNEKQIRVRVKPEQGQASMCIKFMNDGISRDEYEADIPFEEGLELFDRCKYQLRKIRQRHYTPDNLAIDLDIYPNGIIIAEVELPSLSTTFKRPDYFIKQATTYEYTNYFFAGVPKELLEGNVCLSQGHRIS